MIDDPQRWLDGVAGRQQGDEDGAREGAAVGAYFRRRGAEEQAAEPDAQAESRMLLHLRTRGAFEVPAAPSSRGLLARLRSWWLAPLRPAWRYGLAGTATVGLAAVLVLRVPEGAYQGAPAPVPAAQAPAAASALAPSPQAPSAPAAASSSAPAAAPAAEPRSPPAAPSSPAAAPPSRVAVAPLPPAAPPSLATDAARVERKVTAGAAPRLVVPASVEAAAEARPPAVAARAAPSPAQAESAPPSPAQAESAPPSPVLAAPAPPAPALAAPVSPFPAPDAFARAAPARAAPAPPPVRVLAARAGPGADSPIEAPDTVAGGAMHESADAHDQQLRLQNNRAAAPAALAGITAEQRLLALKPAAPSRARQVLGTLFEDGSDVLDAQGAAWLSERMERGFAADDGAGAEALLRLVQASGDAAGAPDIREMDRRRVSAVMAFLSAHKPALRVTPLLPAPASPDAAEGEVAGPLLLEITVRPVPGRAPH